MVSFLPTVLLAQGAFTIKGKVYDAESHEPVEGATIFMAATSTYSEIDGSFVFQNMPQGEHQVAVSLLGYEQAIQTITLNKDLLKLHFHLDRVSTNLEPVIVESDFLQSGPKEKTQNVEMVNEEFLEKNYGNTLANTIEKIPGITSMNTGVGISKPVIRGMSFNRVIVNENGVKQEGQQWGADHGLEIDQYNVERLEVIKGPGSLMYGSDGISGVINILPPRIPEKGTIGAEVNTFYRSNNEQLGVSTSLKGNLNDIFFRARFTYLDFADYKVPADSFTYNSFVLPIYDRRLENTAGSETNLSGVLGIKRKKGVQTLSVSNFHQKSGFFPGAIGIPRVNALTAGAPRRDVNLPFQETNHFKALFNSKLYFGQHIWLTDVGFQDNLRKELSNAHSHGKGPVAEDSLAHNLRLNTLTLNTRFIHNLSEHLTTKYGISAQAQRNERGGFEFLIPNHQSLIAGGYILADYEIGSFLNLSGGVRFDYGKVQSESFLEPIYEDSGAISGYSERVGEVDRDFYNWSGALGLSWYPSEMFNLKINFGRAFRIPTVPELAENGVHHGTFRHEQGTSTLSPETGYMFDLGFSVKRKDFLFKVTPFFNYFDNYIFLRPSGSFSTLPDAGQIYRYSEANAIHTGFEALVEYHLIKELHISAGAEYVWNYNLKTFLPLPFTPPFSLSTQADYTFENIGKVIEDLFFGVEYKFVTAQNRVDRNEATTPGYHLLHFFSGTSFRIKQHKFTLNFRINNLLNTTYMNHLSRYRILNLPEQGRNFTIDLKIPFVLKTNKKTLSK